MTKVIIIITKDPHQAPLCRYTTLQNFIVSFWAKVDRKREVCFRPQPKVGPKVAQYVRPEANMQPKVEPGFRPKSKPKLSSVCLELRPHSLDNKQVSI